MPVKDVDIAEKMGQNFLDYSVSVIRGRSLPDVRDGLKPIHRRIIEAMRCLKLMPNGGSKKCARIIGDVLGKYHVHGDQAAYEALVRMGQNFNLNDPIIKKQGNFGSQDNSKQFAAMRYTEAKLSKFGAEFIKDITYDTVDFIPNYDGNEIEPVVLPVPFPYFLLGSNMGIAVGFTTDALPYNFNEIAKITELYIGRNGNISEEEILDIVKGPDFPTGGIIIERKGVKAAITKGKAVIPIRSKYTVLDDKFIKVTEIPYSTDKSKVLESIGKAITPTKEKNKPVISPSITEVAEVRDLSAKGKIDIRIRCKVGCNPEVVAMKLFKHTLLQNSLKFSATAIVDNKPKELSLKESLGYWYKFRIETLHRKNQFLADKTSVRIHILNGLIKIFSNPDKAIQIIKKAENIDIAAKGLMKVFKLSREQANYILSMQLTRFVKSNIAKTEEELANLKRELKEYKKRLEDNNMTIRNDMIIELKDLKKKYGKPRRTEIININTAEIINEADMIEEQRSIIFLSKKGYIKRLPETYQTSQHRGGKGRLIGCKAGDYIHKIISCSSHDDILFITNFGKVFCIKAYKIGEAGIDKIGMHTGTLVELKEKEYVTSAFSVSEYSKNKDIIVLTRNGYIKKTSLNEFSNVNKGGLIVGKIREGDEFIACEIIDSKKEANVIVGLSNGRVVQFGVEEIPKVKRTTFGVRSTSNSEAKCISFQIITDLEGSLILVSSNGIGKRVSLSEFNVTHRNTKGIIGNKLREGSELIGVIKVNDDDEVIIVSTKKVIKLRVSDISCFKRPTFGSTLIKLGKGEKCVSIAKAIGE